MENNVRFFKKLRKQGDSLIISIPPELCIYLNLQEESEIVLIGDNGAHGRFIALWKKENNISAE